MLERRLKNNLGRVSITTRFGLGIGLLLLLFVVVAATGTFALLRTERAENSIMRSRQVQSMVLEMDRGLEQARRLHGDFFLHYPHIGFAAAHERYAQASVRETARVLAIGNELRGMISGSSPRRPLKGRIVELNLYLSTTKRFSETSIDAVELVTELAAPNRGLETLLKNGFTALTAATADSVDLLHQAGMARNLGQEYLLSRKRPFMQGALNTLATLRQEASARTDDLPARADILRELETLEQTALEILQIDEAVKSKLNDFALQAESLAGSSTALLAQARKEVDEARASIDRLHRLSLWIMAIVTLAGLTAAILISWQLHRTITHRILTLTRTAESMRQGNLQVTALEEGDDELCELAVTFNLMAGRIRELVDGLESKVSQRTAELAASEKRFRQLFDHMKSGVVVYQPDEQGMDFVIRDCNRAAERIEGVRREAILGRKVSQVFPGVEGFGLLEVFRKSLQSGQVLTHPITLYKDERIEGWRENTVYPLPSGEVVAVYDDLTEQKRAEAEKRKMKIRLQRAQKMEAIGLLAGGVAHDLNNILAALVGYPELLLLQLPKDSELREPIAAIGAAGQRAAAVVADLLTVARGVAAARELVDLNSLLGEYLLSPEGVKLKDNHPDIRCISEPAPQHLPVSCSPVHIKKSIMNLATNAMEAIDGPGQVLLATSRRTLDAEEAADIGLQPGDYAVLTVRDNGSGISEQDLAHIFEPFYSKKIMGRSGTGLGLAVVWNTIKDHGGTVLVESSRAGTLFTLYLPLAADSLPDKAENDITPAGLRGRGEKILVVDDERQVRALAADMLRVMGYQVTTVSSGEEALRFLRDNRVDLVLLDMLMEPGLNGRQTYEQAVALHPGLRAVIMSGYSESEEVRKARGLGAGAFLRKPFTVAQLGRTVQDELAR